MISMFYSKIKLYKRLANNVVVVNNLKTWNN